MNIFFATQGTCTLNGQAVDCGELVNKAEPFIAWGMGLLLLLGALLVASLVFWLLMLIHTIRHKSPDRTIWIAILLASFITGFWLIGALVYYFAEKKKAEAATTPEQQPSPAVPPENPQQPQQDKQ